MTRKKLRIIWSFTRKMKKSNKKTEIEHSTSANKNTMHKIKHRNYFPFLIPLLAVIFVDQFSKHLIKENFYLGSSKEILQEILSFTYVQNTGVSFGLLKGINLVFVVISFVALGFFIFIQCKISKSAGICLRRLTWESNG